MSTVNLNTKDVLVANNNTDPISLLRKGIIKRDSLIGAKEFITIPNAPENFAKRIVSSVPVTIDGIKVKVGDTKTIAEIYANVMEEVTIPEVKEVIEPVHLEEPKVVDTKEVEEKANESELTAYMEDLEREEQLSKDITEAEVDINASEEVIEEDETDGELVESTNNNNQNNQFNYKKKRRR